MTMKPLIPMRLVMLSALFLILEPCCKKAKDDSDTVKDIDGNVDNTDQSCRWRRIIMHDRDNVERIAPSRKEGLSVRCVKD